MVWGLIAAAVISAASAAARGSAQSAASKRNAANARNLAWFNASQTIRWGERQSAMHLMSAQANAYSIIQALKLDKEDAAVVTERNVSQLRLVQAYNSDLADTELDSLYESLDLDKQLATRAAKEARGQVIATQAASGTVVGSGSNADVISQILADEEFQTLVMQQNAENNASAILNAKAQGEWQTEAQIANLRFNGALSASVNTRRSREAARQQLFNAAMNIVSTDQSANNSAVSTMFSGNTAASQYSAQANMEMTNGLFSAGAALAEGAADYAEYS